GFLRGVLTNDILIKGPTDFRRLGHTNIGGLSASILVEFLVENAFANVYTAIADIDAWSGDQFANFRMALATKRAHGEVGSAGHIFEKLSYPPTLRGKAVSATSTDRSPEGGFAPSSSFTSLRDLITSSTRPYTFAS